jgi:hypothetical protein
VDGCKGTQIWNHRPLVSKYKAKSWSVENMTRKSETSKIHHPSGVLESAGVRGKMLKTYLDNALATRIYCTLQERWWMGVEHAWDRGSQGETWALRDKRTQVPLWLSLSFCLFPSVYLTNTRSIQKVPGIIFTSTLWCSMNSHRLERSRSYFTTDGRSVDRSVCQYVLVSSTLVGLATGYITSCRSVTGHFYMQVLQRLRDAVRKKRRYKWQAGTVLSASRQRTEQHIT